MTHLLLSVLWLLLALFFGVLLEKFDGCRAYRIIITP
jgi:hypothetical protein